MSESNKWKNHFINMSKSANRSKFYLFKQAQPSKVQITSQTEDAVNRAKDILKGGTHVRKSAKPKLNHDSPKKHSSRKAVSKNKPDAAAKNSSKNNSRVSGDKIRKVGKKKSLKSIKGGGMKKVAGSEITVFESI